ncbi:MAG: hypothetical protein U0Q11_21845 [Vicinamibacterales bacterium]
MWWKRRPTGQLAIPMAPKDPRVYLSLAAVLVPCVVIYPLVGASIIVVLAVDVVVRRVATAVRPMQASRA